MTGLFKGRDRQWSGGLNLMLLERTLFFQVVSVQFNG
jgi:hypothetical protein